MIGLFHWLCRLCISSSKVKHVCVSHSSLLVWNHSGIWASISDVSSRDQISSSLHHSVDQGSCV